MEKEDKIRIIENAIMQGMTLFIQYNGGSQPGTYRHIKPNNIDKGIIWAYSKESNSIKCFSIDKIIICENDKEGALLYDPNYKRVEKYKSILDIYNQEKDYLLSLGWIINHDKRLLTLHKCFKNGRIIKKPYVGIMYNEYVNECIIDPDTYEYIAPRKNSKPFEVFGKDYFSNMSIIDNAAKKFLELSEKESPNNKS